ncbi:MAG: PA2169 family four-helix-bundle protein [Brevundimonas sp.]|uniref:PA2169 family four-helix-bundle protein n=1 Tax=Brevundimonas sp. TaxID=1871086 RepID=UPI00248877E2|nr:PA2169 family four-helix-bundle protein [Brevundimonas sp.]MDI1327792.1 PA2169 family four-helix-bundle protein [Brevundimonas sp.]
MSTPNHHDIHVLNSLIETTIDSADGYREAAKETEKPTFKALFEARSFERQQVVTDLQGAVRTLGGDPEDDGTILAKAHRAFLDVKHALLRDEQAVVNSVETGEDFIKGKFETALEDSDVSATTRETIRRAYTTVKDGHDQMRDLKHSLEGQKDADGRLYPN